MSRRTPGIDPRTFDRYYKDPLLGIDEVGTGALAGPICVAGAILPRDPAVRDLLSAAGLRDSKEMTGYTREKVFELLQEHAVWSTVLFAWSWEIEEEGHHPCLVRLFTQAMTKYLVQHGSEGDILIDGDRLGGIPYTHFAVRKGDQKSQTIAAASVLAKVTRDRLMMKLAREYPGYDFENNVGYGTRAHKKGLNALGPCEIHRRNTKPVKQAGGLPMPKKTFSQF